ncbi:MAG: alpha/beta hydrolase-fold protein [Actinomycetaceae bacterium]|nr:alpha/beta hydrolase-fold protein [Actinomycetaceae bacterium]
MAMARMNLFSKSLDTFTSVTVTLPDEPDPDNPPALLIFLHGLRHDDTVFTRRVPVEHLSANRNIVCVFPSAARTWYIDRDQHLRWFTWVAEELPALVRATFRVSTKRENTFVAGLSMGGYGAVKAALRHPETFAAALSLSGALDITSPEFLARHPELSCLAAPTISEGDDLFRLIDNRGAGAGTRDATDAVGAGVLGEPPSPISLELSPKLWLTCGQEDPKLADSERFALAARAAGLGVTERYTAGEHDFAFWAPAFEAGLNWIDQQRQ